jgi:hypothetical protein
MWLPEMLTADDGWRSESATPGKLRFHRAAHFGEQDGNVLDFETSAYTPAERASFSVAESLCPLNRITGTRHHAFQNVRRIQAVHHWHRKV